MRQATPFKRLELMFLALIPVVITLLLLLLYLTPTSIAGLNAVMPVLPMIPVFYWGLSYGREMPYWFVFLVGLVVDASLGTPMGLSSLLYLFFLVMAQAQRKYIHKEGFAIKWAYFVALLLLTTALHWVSISLLHSAAQPFGAAAIQWLLTVGCYPLLHKLFDHVSDYIQQRRWRILHGH